MSVGVGGKRCFLNQYETHESWEMLLVAFLKPPGELCWMFCLLFFCFTSGDVSQLLTWLHHSSAAFGGQLLLPGYGTLCSSEGSRGSQREQPSGYSLYYNGFQTHKGLKMFWRVVFPAFSLALGFFLLFSGAVSRLLLPSLISSSACGIPPGPGAVPASSENTA